MQHFRQIALRASFLVGAAMPAIVVAPSLLSRACADEPAPESLRDEEVYGKHAIGPTTPTPLDQAVKTLNKSLAEHPSKATLEPVTVEEVVSVIRNWNREAKPVAAGTYRLYERIAETKTLPPHSLLALNEQWFQRGQQEQRVLQIKLEAMTGKNQGDGFVIREHTLESRPFFASLPGYRWIRRPELRDNGERGWKNWSTSSVRVSFDDTHEDALVVNVDRFYDVFSVQVVAFDKNEKRFDLSCQAMGAYDKFLNEQFRLSYENLPRDRIKYVGVEAVTREDLDTLAWIAANRAKGQQIELLPLPEVGRAYDFSMTAGGKAINSQQLRGKVILIDLWGSWCIPCLKKMPELKTFYSKLHDQGLEVIGVSFDDNGEDAQAVIERMAIPWPSTNIAKDTAVRKLWDSRDRVTRLPTVLVIDANGILRYELFSDSENVEEKIEGLLAEAKRAGQQ